MSDDQTQEEMRFMDRTRDLLGERGATFPHSFANWPVCCPSRATFLTGQYAHNHQVLGNRPPLGGFERLDGSETLPVWLQRAGYHTAHIGKYLNGYENSEVGVPPGWSEWHGSKRTYLFYGYSLLEDGEEVVYGDPQENPDDPAAPGTYSSDVYTDKAVELISRRSGSPEPFFLSLAYLAPHSGGPNPDAPNQSRCQGTAKPAPRHIGAFASEPLPQPPNFNEADVADKPSGIAIRELLTANQIARATRNYRCRAESLLAIDEGVGRVVDALRAAGELENTLIVYTSDNGFFHGEHRIVSGKNRVYEEAIRVPLLMRGPGVGRDVAVDELAVNADLAATILDAADAKAGRIVDGRSLLSATRHPERLRGRELLIEQEAPGDIDEEGNPGTEYRAIRNDRYAYVENASGEVELYDIRVDPYQLQNLALDPEKADEIAALHSRLAQLRGCSGARCRAKPALRLKLPKPKRARGRSCRDPHRFLVRLKGTAKKQVIAAEWLVGAKRDALDQGGPFKERLKPRLLRRAEGLEIRAVVDLLDGRRLTLQERVRICR
jgi:arylsulfatase A-like enzyme